MARIPQHQVLALLEYLSHRPFREVEQHVAVLRRGLAEAESARAEAERARAAAEANESATPEPEPEA